MPDGLQEYTNPLSKFTDPGRRSATDALGHITDNILKERAIKGDKQALRKLVTARKARLAQRKPVSPVERAVETVAKPLEFIQKVTTILPLLPQNFM